MSDVNNIIVEVRNISKDFGMVRALNDVSFSLKKGKILGLVGDNGAGKSTLLKILCGLYQPTKGEIFINGKEVRAKNPSDMMKKRVAIAHQFLELVDSATVWENFYIGRELTLIKRSPFLNIRKMKEISSEAISRHGPNIDVETEIGMLAGEQRQIVAVTRALEANPQILLLDETFTLLSLEGKEEMSNYLKKINEATKTTMILVSHDLDLVKDLSDYIMVLKSGEDVFYGHAEEISTDEIVKYMLP